MSEKKENKSIFSGLANLPWIQKLKSVKHIGIIVAIIFIILLLIIALSGTITTSSNTENTTLNYNYISSSVWIEETETKIQTLVTSLKNAGNVQVMVTLESAPEIVLASNVEQTTNTSTTSDGKIETVTVTTTPILLEEDGVSNVLVITEKLPKVKGVVITASGASDPGVRLNIIAAIQTLLSLDSSRIQVFVGN